MCDQFSFQFENADVAIVMEKIIGTRLPDRPEKVFLDRILTHDENWVLYSNIQ